MNKEVCYTQVWRVEDWLADFHGIAYQIFEQREEIQWIEQQGFKSRSKKHFDMQTGILEVSVVFDLPEEFVTLLLLIYPNQQNRIEIGD